MRIEQAASGVIEFPETRSWPHKRLGLAMGWQGWAWLWLHLLRRGVVEENPRVWNLISRRLQEIDSMTRQPHAISPVLGSGAYPVLAALAADTRPEYRRALEKVIACWARACSVFPRADADLMHGSAGGLLACAEIEGYVPGVLPAALPRQLRREAIHGLKRLLSPKQPRAYLGLAHGIAGYVLALETTDAVFGLRIPTALRERAMNAVISAIIPLRPRGGDATAAWPILRGGKTVQIHGWCNGAPGIGLAMLCCHTLSGRPDYRDLARAALNGTAMPETGPDSFCCGSIGRAHVLIEAFRQTGEVCWLRAARTAHRGQPPLRPGRTGLLNGALGYRFLRWRMQSPSALPMPWMGILSSDPIASRAR